MTRRQVPQLGKKKTNLFVKSPFIESQTKRRKEKRKRAINERREKKFLKKQKGQTGSIGIGLELGQKGGGVLGETRLVRRGQPKVRLKIKE